MLSYEPTEDQELMRRAVADFAKASLSPRIRAFEAARALPDEVVRAAAELGLDKVLLPEDCLGAGLGMVSAAVIEEEIAKADAAAAAAFPWAGPFQLAVMELAGAKQRQDVFSGMVPHCGGAVAWSEPAPNRDRPGFSTVATPLFGSSPDGSSRHPEAWQLTGKKCFVGNADRADWFIVFAQVDESAGWNGIGAFVVSHANPGLVRGKRHDTLGLDAAHFGEIELTGAKVDKLPAPHSSDARLLPADFTAATLRFWAKHALVVAARAVGLASAAFELARSWCDTRVAFGKPIGHFQAVAFNLADRLMDVDSARSLVWRAAWHWDAGKDERACLLASAQAAAQALEAAMRCADDCVSLHGGAGFIRDVAAEKLMRDAKQLALSCPTAAQLDQLAAAVELGCPLDPALVLPTPEAQAIFT